MAEVAGGGEAVVVWPSFLQVQPPVVTGTRRTQLNKSRLLCCHCLSFLCHNYESLGPLFIRLCPV